ncbi:hypothetical protein O6P43_030710, partial [Quillaja saponaria]
LQSPAPRWKKPYQCNCPLVKPSPTSNLPHNPHSFLFLRSFRKNSYRLTLLVSLTESSLFSLLSQSESRNGRLVASFVSSGALCAVESRASCFKYQEEEE